MTTQLGLSLGGLVWIGLAVAVRKSPVHFMACLVTANVWFVGSCLAGAIA